MNRQQRRQQMPKHTPREKEAAYHTLEKATNDELAQVAKHVLGYDPFELDKKKLILPSATRAQTLAILKTKIISNQMTFEKND